MLKELAPIADFLAAIGVIISLIFVYIELRRANKEQRKSHWYKNMEVLFNYHALTDDPYISEVVIKGRNDLGQLSENEYLVFDRYMHRCILTYNHFRRNTSSIVEERNAAEKVLKANIKKELDHPGIRQWWEVNRKSDPFAKSTVDWVEGILK